MNGTPSYWQGAAGYGSQSAYDPRSPYYNPFAMGNQPFFIPSGQPQGQGQSPVSGAIQGMMPGGMGPGLPSVGQVPTATGPLAGYGQPFPGGGVGGMDPRYFGQLYAPQQLAGQQFTQQQAGIGEAIARGKALMGGMGMPAEGGLGDLETWAQQRAALEAEPIRRQTGEAMRTIEDIWARKGSALGSEHERNIAEIQGASLSALRSSAIGAAIDAFMKRPQILAQLIAASR